MLNNLQKSVTLAPYTTYRIGGNADYFFVAKTKEALIEALAWASKEGIAYVIIGGGSNLLISDAGFRGLVILNRSNKYSISDGLVISESGMILSIGEWVLQEAVSQFMIWRKQFAHTINLKKIADIVSVHQFNAPNFLMQVENIIAQSGIVKEHLELELTESIIVKDISGVRAKMQQLRDLGVNLSIDDFGTGYSSLSYLKKLPFTTLKIDKSFTQDIGNDVDDKELISTIITIAENFNLEVVIEGVETYEQYAFVNERKATFMQGYFCSKPMEKESFEAMLESSNGICSIMTEAKEKI